MKILYKLPSRSRPNKFFATVENIILNATIPDYSILASLDVDDLTMLGESVKQRIASYPQLKTYWSFNKTKIEACNANMEFSSEWDIAVLISDDQKIIKPGFDKRIIEIFQEHSADNDLCLHLPDNTKNARRIITMPILGKKYYERFGYWYYPAYKTWYCDQEMTEVAKLIRKYKFIDERWFDHNHWLFGFSKPDNLNMKNDNGKLTLQDKILFDNRAKNNFGLSEKDLT